MEQDPFAHLNRLYEILSASGQTFAGDQGEITIGDMLTRPARRTSGAEARK